MDTGKKFIQIRQKGILEAAIVKDLMPHVIFKEAVTDIEYDGSVDGQPVAKLTNRVEGVEETAGTRLQLVIDNQTYRLQANLYNAKGSLVSSSDVIDLPIEEMIVKVSYDEASQSLVFELKSGAKTIVPISKVITGLATRDWVSAGFATKDEHNALKAKMLFYEEVVNI